MPYTPKPIAPRPARPAAVKIAYLRQRLATQLAQSHLVNALKTTQQLLALDPTPVDALTRASILLRLGRFEDALAALPAAGGEFERAYALYRLGRLAEARTVLEQGVEDGEAKEMLEAQIAYATHAYPLAAELFSNLTTITATETLAAAAPLLEANLTLATSLADFLATGFLEHTRDAEDTLDLDALEEEVPILPKTVWSEEQQPIASGSRTPLVWGEGAKKAAAVAAAAAAGEGEKKKRRSHRLPKGAVEGRPFTEDPERWLPLRARTNQVAAPIPGNYANSKNKKGNGLPKKEGMGAGMTQGSVASAPPTAQTGGSGGGKKKKGRK